MPGDTVQQTEARCQPPGQVHRPWSINSVRREGSPPDRTRLLTFVNLPPECWVRIYTLDGDLVREWFHGEGAQYENQDTWNLITRNTQMVVPGLYYWTVEDAVTGKVQMGKLAVIM